MKRFYQSVTDILSCVDYLENIGMEKIHIMGFSFGGMIGTISKALDNRLDKCSCNIERCHKLHENFDEQAKKFSSIDDLNSLPNCFRYDPSLFAKMINPDKVLMINAAFDPFIPRKSSKDL